VDLGDTNRDAVSTAISGVVRSLFKLRRTYLRSYPGVVNPTVCENTKDVISTEMTILAVDAELVAKNCQSLDVPAMAAD
jgi:hypothetical protein